MPKPLMALIALLHGIEMRRIAAGVSEPAAFADAFTVVFLSVAVLLAGFFALTGLWHRGWHGQ